MPSETFERTLKLASDRTRVWDAITDVPTLISWISLLDNAEIIAPLERYSARLRDRIGMFSLEANLDIMVLEVQAPERITIRATGEDRQVASRILVDVTVEVSDVGDITRLHTRGNYEVSGRVATLGSGSIRKKASRVLDEFFTSVERELGS